MDISIISSIAEQRKEALKLSDRIQIYSEGFLSNIESDYTIIEDTAFVLELAVHNLLLEKAFDDELKLKRLRELCIDAFKLFRVLPRPENPLDQAIHLLRMGALAILGDKGSDAARILRSFEWSKLPFDSENWGERTWATILDIWLRLIRKKGWDDRDIVLERIALLRTSQQEFESRYLKGIDLANSKAAALELIGLYHLGKAAEIFALFITNGVVEGNYQVHQLLESHFDRIYAVCKHARMLRLEPLSRLLEASSSQMVENSIWTVTRAVNSRVTNFVKSLVARGRGDKAIFEVLPPQRLALYEKGLLGSSRRAVVVSLPTSSGKTLIAQFRILQALNQFDEEQGWVAYLVPTKALGNQITRQLRRDFSDFNPPINIEQISPALEIDTAEVNLLVESSKEHKFRVLIATPEKFDLLIRQGWEKRIGRPLTLVIVDEAHNLKNGQRGLRLELLLATINKECEKAQFLLLTPFINNAQEIAYWLGGRNSDQINLAIDWQPNDRIIGIIQAQGLQGLGDKKNYNLIFNSVHTTNKTINFDEEIIFPKNNAIAESYAQVHQDVSTTAAVTAQYLHKRGPVIVMHSRPDWVWSLANKFKIEDNFNPNLSDQIQLVQNYLRLELGEQFPLIELLTYGIGVHHAGLPDDVRNLIEWLFEEGQLKFLVATTTIAQGVNFPVSGVVMASHNYFSRRYAVPMPSEDFWNIAGRAGRVSHGQLGVIALVAKDDHTAEILREFINISVGDLNSALIQLAVEAGNSLSDLGVIVYNKPEWSSFLQYLAHTYRQMGQPDSFFEEIEQVLRGTLGFEKLRKQNSSIAEKLLAGIKNYTDYLQRPDQPLKLVDSTGFSLQSIMTVLNNKGSINAHSWNHNTLFTNESNILQQMMGVLLKVPELRENLKAVTGGPLPNGDKLALIIKDWVNGEPIPIIAERHFKRGNEDLTKTITRCGQNLFGKLTQTASWGLGALLSITASDLPEEELKILSNLPSRVFYGVNSDAAVTLRLLGVPRTAAPRLAIYLSNIINNPLPNIRDHLAKLTPSDWQNVLGAGGETYQKIWKLQEGL